MISFYFQGPGVSLTLCCFVVYSARRFVVCLSVCHFVLVFFGPFGVAVASLGEVRAYLSAFRTFVRFVCLDLSISSSSWGLGRAAVCDCGTPWTFLLPFFLRKCFLEISIRLEVLLAALFISVSNRYQKKTMYLLFATG